MKKFTCREMGGPCDEVFEGETMHNVAEMGGKHIMSTTDEAHKVVRDQMTSETPEGKEEWFTWFKGEWDKKELSSIEHNHKEGETCPVCSVK